MSRVKNPLRGQQIYQRAFTPTQQFLSLNQFLLDADTKFGYNSNFKEYFSYTTCSTCNSKLQCLKNSDKKAQNKKIQKLKRSRSNKKKVQNDEVIVLDSLPNGNNKKRARDHSAFRKKNGGDNNNEVIELEDDDDNSNDDKDKIDNYKDDDGDDNRDEDEGDDRNFDDDDGDENYEEEEEEDYNKMEDYDNTSYDEDDIIDEIKIQLVVKDKDTKTPTAKILAIQPVSYKNVMEKINLTTKKILGKKFKSNDNYIISYKVMNARGPSNTLEDKLDFQEFVSEYRKIISSGKKMLVMVTVKDNVIEKKSEKHKMVSFLYILL